MLHTGSQQEGKGKLPGHKNYISSETLQKINRVIFTEQSKGMPPANPTARAINKLKEQTAEVEAKDPKIGLTIALVNERRAELDKLIKQYASYQNPFCDTSQLMENPWPGTALSIAYEYEYESDDNESPHRQRCSESGDRRFKERHSRSKKGKRTHTSTPPSSPYFSPRKTHGQGQREQKKVKKEQQTPRGKGNMVQSWYQ